MLWVYKNSVIIDAYCPWPVMNFLLLIISFSRICPHLFKNILSQSQRSTVSNSETLLAASEFLPLQSIEGFSRETFWRLTRYWRNLIESYLSCLKMSDVSTKHPSNLHILSCFYLAIKEGIELNSSKM